MSSTTTVLVIGGTGAQGQAVIRVLAATNKYHILVPTRNVSSPQAQALSALSHVEVVPSNSTQSFDPDTFSALAARADAVFVNTDGFSLGEALETFWGIRLFELSARAGVKHLIYSGLDYNGRASGYDPKLYVGHYEGKARVQEWIHAQGKDFPMAWTIIRSGPYAEMLHDNLRPVINDDGHAIFQLPLGEGEMPFVSLVDFGRYVDWALSNLSESRGLDFGIAIEHAGLQTLVDAYTAVTGKTAEHRNLPVEDWGRVAWAQLPEGGQTKVGFAAVQDPAALNLTFEQNFVNWWNLYQAKLVTRDYAFLNRILPTRIRSMEEWMRSEDFPGERKVILKASYANVDRT